MMYPFMTLNDDTEITHSEMKADGKAKVYIETPDEFGGFHNATCWFGPGQERNLDRLGLPKGHGNCHCADEAELFENLKNAVKIYVFALKKLDKRIKEIR